MRCGTPYCDAPIRHTDHADPHVRGGPTNEVNGLGTCEACNYTKEAPDWQVTTAAGDEGRHTARYQTPTGARYNSQAPPLPGQPGERRSHIEIAFADELAWRNAA